MGLRERCGRGLWRSGVVIVVTVSSKEFLGTVGTRFACGKPEKNSWRASLGGCSKLRFRCPTLSRKLRLQCSLPFLQLINGQQISAIAAQEPCTSPDGRTFVWKGLRLLPRRFCRPLHSGSAA